MVSLGETDKTAVEKRPNWFARAFLGKPSQDGESARPKPCKGKNCKPVSPPPGPHPTPPPVPAPILGSAAGYCWGYLDRCDRRGNCYAHFARVDYSRCELILRQLKQEEGLAADLKNNQQSACSADPQNANCVAATGDLHQAETKVGQLRQQYKMCLTAATPLLSREWPLLQSILNSGP